jgi:hypothetical protein
MLSSSTVVPDSLQTGDFVDGLACACHPQVATHSITQNHWLLASVSICHLLLLLLLLSCIHVVMSMHE